MTGTGNERTRQRRNWLLPAIIVFTAAVIMGLPTLRGSFVGGDDHRLALNHVLVNHPSFAHAVELFTIVHRDLYQPLPLLSFQIEFAIANALGLFEQDLSGGAWLFHLTNILLHAVNAVLVLVVVRRLHERAGAADVSSTTERSCGPDQWDVGNAAPVVAFVVALLFAIHPLQTEVVAWTNGRMMLMSTLFAMLAMLWFASWLDRATAFSAILAIVFVLLSAISKVRISLPLLLVIVAIARRSKFDRRFIALWLACSAITAVFVLINVWATASASLFSEAAEHLKGPRAVRVLLALGCYFQHIVWPVGLGSYYPTPPVVHWSDAGTWRAACVVVPSLFVLGWACRRSRVARLGVLWFFVTIASTLPFIPARNVLAADRYMYLPIIGLAWLIVASAWSAHQRWLTRWPRRWRRVAVAVLAALVAAGCIGLSWRVGDSYTTPLKKTRRTANLFPDTPRVWERLGWTLFGEGQYTEAMECARKELRHDDAPIVKSGAYQLLGMCELHRGNADTALEHLHKALEVHPGNSMGLYRLAMACDDLGRTAEAVKYFEAAVQASPQHNPRIIRLASLYRRTGRPAEARALYDKALATNPYEAPATMGLVELEIEEGTRESYLAAERLLVSLLDWMPENADALTNLGAVRRSLGKTREAIKAYVEALDLDQNHVTAVLNLAQVYYGTGDVRRAHPLFERLVVTGMDSFDQTRDVHDFFVSQGHPDRCVALWDGFVVRSPDSTEGRAFLAWSCALAGDRQRARTEIGTLEREPTGLPLAAATLAYLDLAGRRYADAAARTDALCRAGDDGADARRRLLGSLEHFDQQQPNIPWTFCLATRLLIADGNIDGAGRFLSVCKERCADTACDYEVDELDAMLSGRRPAASTVPEAP